MRKCIICLMRENKLYGTYGERDDSLSTRRDVVKTYVVETLKHNRKKLPGISEMTVLC